VGVAMSPRRIVTSLPPRVAYTKINKITQYWLATLRELSNNPKAKKGLFSIIYG